MFDEGLGAENVARERISKNTEYVKCDLKEL